MAHHLPIQHGMGANIEVMDCKTVEEAVHAIHQPTTTWLIANGRHFGDAEARKIARALRSNTTLKELSLAGNQIGPDGAAALGAAVGQHPRLREFYLHKNKLGAKGVERMMAAIESSGGAPSLQLLHIGKNGIGPRLSWPTGIFQSLRTLNLTNNNLSELPPRMAQCAQLEEVLLDGNPLISPPIQLYNRSGWDATKKFLVSTQDFQREENRRAGFGSVTHDERDEALLKPALDALYQGRLGESLSLVHSAKEELERVGLTGRFAVSRADELAFKIAILSTIEGASEPSESDCELHVNERVYMVNHAMLSKSKSLAALLKPKPRPSGTDGEDELQGPECNSPRVHEKRSSPFFMRLQARIDDTSTLGFKCFLSYLCTDDLELSVQVCLREHDDLVTARAKKELLNNKAGSHDESDSDSDSDTGSGSGSEGSGSVPAGGPVSTWMPPKIIKNQSIDKLGFPMYLKRNESSNIEEFLPVAVNVLIEMVCLAKRFGCPHMCDAGLEMLWDILQPEHAIWALKAAHLSGDQSVKDVCLEFVKECCVHVDKQDWALLREHGDLMLEIMDVLAQRENQHTSQDEVRNQLLHHVIVRLDAVEERLAEERALRQAAEDKFMMLLNVMTTNLGPTGLTPSPSGAFKASSEHVGGVRVSFDDIWGPDSPTANAENSAKPQSPMRAARGEIPCKRVDHLRNHVKPLSLRGSLRSKSFDLHGSNLPGSMHWTGCT